MIHIKLTDAVTFKNLAKWATTKEEINFARKVIINEGGDPNKYFEQRTVLQGDNIIQKQGLENGSN